MPGDTAQAQAPEVPPTRPDGSVERDGDVRIEPVLGDVVEEDCKGKPEMGAVEAAFELEMQGGAAGIFARQRAMFRGQFGGKQTEIAGFHLGAPIFRALPM